MPEEEVALRHVVVATDEGFAMPTAVTLRSLLVHGGGSFSVTVLHDSITTDARRRILNSLPTTDVEVSWVDAGKFEVRASKGTHLTRATYFRLWVVDAVPPETRAAALYLDVDLIVRRDLAELWAWDLGGCAVAAVQSVHYPFVATRGAVNDWRALGLAATPFFNAGVLLIDLDRWRSEDVEARALEYLRSPHLGGGADQEALNAALAGRWSRLHPVWNQQTPMLTDDYGADLVFQPDEIEAARGDPAIVHFQTRPKPWQRGCSHLYRAEWSEHAAEVDFDKVSGIRERSLWDEAHWRFRRAVSALVWGR